ncbi:MAG: class I SAM-dependent methyltransferase [Terriglobia bacterium]
MEMQEVYASQEHEQAKINSATDFARGTRLLDIGCGQGNGLLRHGTEDYKFVVGVDIKFEPILKARITFPDCHFVVARAKALPFADGSFDRAISDAALPYTDITEALKDVSRVLAPGGTATLKLHSLRFATSDLWRRAKLLSAG